MCPVSRMSEKISHKKSVSCCIFNLFYYMIEVIVVGCLLALLQWKIYMFLPSDNSSRAAHYAAHAVHNMCYSKSGNFQVLAVTSIDDRISITTTAGSHNRNYQPIFSIKYKPSCHMQLKPQTRCHFAYPHIPCFTSARELAVYLSASIFIIYWERLKLQKIGNSASKQELLNDPNVHSGWLDHFRLISC